MHPDPRRAFAEHALELLAPIGPCVARRLFGGWGLSTGGLTVAIITDLGGGDTLWLKAGSDTRAAFEAAGCARFTYTARGRPRGLDYYSAPPEALESPAAMTPWARLALQAALAAAARRTPAGPPTAATRRRPRAASRPRG